MIHWIFGKVFLEYQGLLSLIEESKKLAIVAKLEGIEAQMFQFQSG